MSALLYNQEPLFNVERADVGPQNTIIALLLYQFIHGDNVTMDTKIDQL